jgi:hypothetical protein
VSELERLFPDGDFRLHLTLRRGRPRDFLGKQDAGGELLVERRRWLGSHPTRHAVLQPEGTPAWREACELLGVCGLLPPASESAPSPAEVGGLVEPDLLVMVKDEAGGWRLRGGVLCFPTSWSLEEKLGRGLEEIHGPVPGLNAGMGPSINQVLARLPPGVSIERDNWGLAATDQLNLHPARGLPAPALPAHLDSLWLRVEHQALIALPRSGAVLFGIRISLHRLDRIVGTAAGRRLARALRSMPREMADYKRVDAVRGALASALA